MSGVVRRRLAVLLGRRQLDLAIDERRVRSALGYPVLAPRAITPVKESRPVGSDPAGARTKLEGVFEDAESIG